VPQALLLPLLPLPLLPLPLLLLLLLLLLLPGCRVMLGCSCSLRRRPTSGFLQATAAER
jgi:hypothetical protein